MHKDDILHYEDNEVIFEEDSIGKELYIIENGKVEISQRIDGKKTTIAVLEKGDFFGEMAVITDAPRSATAKAIGRTTLKSFSEELVLQNMQSNPRFTVNLLQTLVNRLRSTTSTLRILIARLYALDAGFVGNMFPGRHNLEADEMIKYLKKQIEIKDKQIERQHAIIMQLSKGTDEALPPYNISLSDKEETE